MATLRRVNDLRSAITAVVAAAALSACGSGGTPAPAAPTPSPAAPPPASTVAVAEPSPDVAPSTLETAVIDAGGCVIDEQYGRNLDGIRFLMTGVGPRGVPKPHEALDGSFTCDVAPSGAQAFGAARYADATQAAEMATWFRRADPCRPVGTVGSWMLFAGRGVGQPQRSTELEDVVSDLGGQMIATCP